MTAVPVPPLTDAELATLEQLLENAPGLPWQVSDSLPDRSIRSDAGWEIVTATYADQRDRLELIVAAVNALPRLVASLRAARERAATCTCGPLNPETYEGPQADCAVHGAIRAFNDAVRENERLRAERDQARAELAAAKEHHRKTVQGVWDDSVPPGGYVCATCGVPTESEPCPDHAPAASEPDGGA